MIPPWEGNGSDTLREKKKEGLPQFTLYNAKKLSLVRSYPSCGGKFSFAVEEYSWEKIGL